MLKAKTNVIRVPSGTGKVADRNGTKSRRLEPNRPKKVPQKSHSNRRIRPGRKVGIPSASALNDIIGVDTEEESAVEKETRKCSADLEERLTEITKQEIENASKLSQRLRKRCDYFQAACKQKQSNIENIRQEIAILNALFVEVM